MKRLGASVIILILLVPSARADSAYHRMRKAFRQEIDKKKVFPIGDLKNIKAILYDSDIGRFSFAISPVERENLMGLVRGFFGIPEGKNLDRIIDGLAEGKIIVEKEFRKAGTAFKGARMHTCFLIPPVPYYNRIDSINRAEQTFSVYNVTASFTEEGAHPAVIGFYQPEGTFFGVTRAVNVPMKAIRKPEKQAVYFSMPTQEEIDRGLAAMTPMSPDRTGLEERFIDTVRQHPFFAEKNSDSRYVVSDEQILKILSILTDAGHKCQIKDTEAYFKVYEGFAGFHVVEYFLTSMANINALFPNIPLLRSIVENIAQAVSDEVSWKYFSLSMKNLRDAVVSDSQKPGREQ